MTLGQRIQELRKQQGLSQEALGEALGVSRQAVSKWEGDNGIPELDTLIAMSRLFGITVGQLLGVESTTDQATQDRQNAKDTAGDTGDEDKIESVLRRYVEQTDKKDQSTQQKRLARIIATTITACVVFVVMFAQLGSLRNTVKLLRSDLSNLQVNVYNSQSNLSGQIRSTIYNVLAEEAKLLSTFGWEITDLDLTAQTATLTLTATMKEYTAGSMLQFCTQWQKVDGTRGQTVGEWAAGPDFRTQLTLPLNHSTEVSIRVKDAEGNIKEQVLDESIYELHPDAFCLDAYNLTVPFSITAKGFGITTTTLRGEESCVQIYSDHPKYVYPEKAVLTAYINNDLLINETLTVTPSDNSAKLWDAKLNEEHYSVTLKNGDKLSVRLTVTDNLGRVEEFFESTEAVDGELVRTQIAVPYIPAD